MASIRRRGQTWAYWVDVGRDASGKRKQKTKGGFPTKRAAQQAARVVEQTVADGSYVEPTRQTLGQYLTTEWLPSIRAHVRPSTWGHYEGNIRRHVVPRIGSLPLGRLSAMHLEALYADLLTDGRADGTGGLSPRTVGHVHRVLRNALADAVRVGKLHRNAAALARPPSVPHREMSVWSPEQLRQFLGYLQRTQDRLLALWVLAATTGLRRGELLGLRWQDVDLDHGRVSVMQTLTVADRVVRFAEPKTARGRRSLALDAATVKVLRAHRARQSEERLAWGAAWPDAGLVFTREDGRHLDPYWPTHALPRLAQEVGLPRIRVHDLRHSYASAALVAGVSAKVVSDRLGHSTIAITLDTYSHVLPALDEEAADRVAALIVGSASSQTGLR